MNKTTDNENKAKDLVINETWNLVWNDEFEENHINWNKWYIRTSDLPLSSSMFSLE